MELTVNNEELYLHINTSLIRIPPIRLQDLNISPGVIQDFLKQDNDKTNIHDCEFGNGWCHILPSMKKGQIVKILNHIPADSPFSSYKDVKKYWKNMYGYRLPETDDGMIYYQIFFKPIGHTLFTYPECCVRLREVHEFKCLNSADIMEQFLKDIHSKMPLLCGHQVQFHSQAMYTVPKLLEVQQGHNQLNLTTNMPIEQRTRPVYEKRVNNYTPWKPSAMTLYQNTKENSNYYSPSIAVNDNNCTNSLRGNVWNNNNDNLQMNNFKVTSENEVVSEVDTSTICRKMYDDFQDMNGAPNMRVKVVPVFKTKVQPKQAFSINNQCKGVTNTKKIVPMFKSTQRKSSYLLADKGNPLNHANNMFDDMQKLGMTVRTSATNVDTHKNRGQFEVNAVKDIFKKHKNCDLQGTNFKYQSNSFGRTSNQVPHPVSENCTTGGSQNLTIVDNITASYKEDHYQTNTPSINTSESNSSVSVLCGQTSISTSTKRHMNQQVLEGESKQKKPRAKPKVQEDVDIESMARLNQLGKVNVLTLTNWLKMKGVACKHREKKAELIDKVLLVLHTKIAEQ